MADATSTTGPVVRGWNANGGAAEPIVEILAQRRVLNLNVDEAEWLRSTDAVGVDTVTPRPNISPLGARAATSILKLPAVVSSTES